MRNGETGDCRQAEEQGQERVGRKSNARQGPLASKAKGEKGQRGKEASASVRLEIWLFLSFLLASIFDPGYLIKKKKTIRPVIRWR